MDPTKKLVIPEINANTLTKEDKIIANPNCSTIQMLVTLAPLHKKYGIKRVVVSTYQSVTGSGLKGINQLEGEREGREVKKHTLTLSTGIVCRTATHSPTTGTQKKK